MKRIIYLTTLLPFPNDMGGKIKTLSTIKELIKEFEISLFSFVDKKEDLIFEKELKKIGVKNCFTLVNHVIAEKHRKNQFFNLFQSFFTDKPYSVYKYYDEKMVFKINAFMKENKVDIFWCDHTIQSQYLPSSFKGLKILETHNFKTDFFKDMFLNENNFFWKFFSLYEMLKFKFYEPKEFKKFDLIYAISEHEKEKISKFNKNVTELFPKVEKNKKRYKANPRKLFFVGLLTWYPNKQGVAWFIKEVFKTLQRRIPGLEFDVVGDCSKRWKVPKVSGVEFHGYVKDIQRFWDSSSIFVVPIFYGSGIRIKILEALAHGLTVVSTKKGVEGLPYPLKKNVFIADNKEKFIEIIEGLLNNKNIARKKSYNYKSSLDLSYNVLTNLKKYE